MNCEHQALQYINDIIIERKIQMVTKIHRTNDTNLTCAVCPKTVARKRGVQPSFSRRGFTSAPALPDEDDHHGDDDEEGVEQEKEENSSNPYWSLDGGSD